MPRQGRQGGRHGAAAPGRQRLWRRQQRLLLQQLLQQQLLQQQLLQQQLLTALLPGQRSCVRCNDCSGASALCGVCANAGRQRRISSSPHLRLLSLSLSLSLSLFFCAPPTYDAAGQGRERTYKG